MFSNPAKKLKTIVIILFWLEMAATFFLGTRTDTMFQGVLVWIAGFLVFWCSSLVLISLCDAVNDIAEIKKNIIKKDTEEVNE